MKHLLLFSFLSCTVTLLYAQPPGTPDKTYGTYNTGVASDTSQFSILSSAIQQDNKLVLGGINNDTVGGEFTAIRRNKDGSADTSFGINGYAYINISNLVTNLRSANGWVGIAVQPDGKIVATGTVGYIYPNNNNLNGADIVVARYLPHGTPDESFGSHGRVITAIAYSEQSDAIVIQPDGKIVVAGIQDTDMSGNSRRILVVRYNADGTLDKSFGNGNGYVAYINGSTETSWTTAMLLQPDGKIVVGGYITHGLSIVTTRFFLVRYLANGVLDASFGNNGRIATEIDGGGTGCFIKSLALDDKERIVAAGVINYIKGGEIVRYLPDGTLDNSFDKDGQLKLTFNGAHHNSVSIGTVLAQPGGKLVVSASYDYTDQLNQYVTAITLSGLNEDGSTDSSFGTNDGQTILFNGVIYNAIALAVMQKDGKIVVSNNNQTFYPFSNTYFLTRFNGYPVHVSLAMRIKRFIHNHSITWNGLPADDNTAYYSVEQSSLSTKGFLPIAKLRGRSNLQDYSISNSSLLPATNYYRVKAVSTDGTVRYSEVVSADNIANTASVFPNPAKSYVTVQGLQSNATANISIKDGSGTVLTRGTSSGSTQYRSQVSNLLPGTYYLNITTAGKTETLPFVKD